MRLLGTISSKKHRCRLKVHSLITHTPFLGLRGFSKRAVKGKSLHLFATKPSCDELNHNRDKQLVRSRRHNSQELSAAKEEFHEYKHGRSVQLHYLRDSNQILLGVDGPKQMCTDLQTLFEEYLMNNLCLDVNKEATSVVHLKEERPVFAGHAIFRQENMGDRVCIELPLEEMVAALMRAGFAGRWKSKVGSAGKVRGDFRPQSKAAWTTLPDHEIVMRYNKVIDRVQAFYGSCTRPDRLRFLHYLLRFSCAMTLAQRHRSSVRKTFTKHGAELRVVFLDQQRAERSVRLRPLLRVRQPWQGAELRARYLQGLRGTPLTGSLAGDDLTWPE